MTTTFERPYQVEGELKDEAAYEKLRERANADRTITSYTSDEGFRLWLAILDLRCGATLGVSLFDLRDFTLRDWYDDGLTPRQALRLMREEGLD